MEDELTLYELSARYFHENDWTYKLLDTDRHDLQVSPFSSYLSPEGEIEISTVRVTSKEVLKLLEKILKNNWKIKRILFLNPINDGYPKILKLGVIGDLRDSIRATAYTLGAIADNAIYYEGEEYWNFIFLQKYGLEAMKNYMEIHGKIRNLKIKEIKTVNILSKYEFKNISIFTPRELEILNIAYKRGLFEFPKENNINDVAKEIGISKSSFNEFLRKALKKIVKSVVDSLNDEN
ncbi:helix-turn-helix domain-containing protein [Acidianus manzaensis]|nr:helix-turn-helix domain-containing protein [Acidianus manzaensis]